MFCRWDVPAPLHASVPPTSSVSADWETDDHPFEPITQPDPLIITNLPESLIWGLPNSALCTMWLFVSCPAALPPFFLMPVRGRQVRGEGEKTKQREGEGSREVGLSAHICTPVSGDVLPI